MVGYVILAVTLFNGQVQDYKPVSEDIYTFESECNQHISIERKSHPEFNNERFALVCAEVKGR